MNFNSYSNGRINETLSFENAISVTYIGYDDLELVFIPLSGNPENYTTYVFNRGALVESVLQIENMTNQMKISNSAGEVVYDIDNNVITNTNVIYYDNTYSSSGRTEDCGGVAAGAISCLDAIQDQAIAAVGEWGALAFDIGCSAFIWCRGSVLVACGAWIAVGCP